MYIHGNWPVPGKTPSTTFSQQLFLDGATTNIFIPVQRLIEEFGMEPNQNLPFEVGQLAEAKSFESGFRGAWFRCKIENIMMKNGHAISDLNFYDFPDDKPAETKLYQMPPAGFPRKEKKLHLMVRPSYPPIYLETQMPTCAIFEVIVIVDNVWNVGDLVDWWANGCYWTGRITQLLGEDKITVKIQLQIPPMGEGRSYEASCKDLRPSLDWSPERGWTVPISSQLSSWTSFSKKGKIDVSDGLTASSQHAAATSPTFKDGGTRQCCARIVEPSSLVIHSEPSQEGKSVQSHAPSVSSHGSADASASANISSSLSKRIARQLSDCYLVEKTERPHHAIKGPDLGDNGLGNPSSTGNVFITYVQRVSAAAENSTGTKGRYISDQPSKKMRLMKEVYLNSCDTIESSIIDLEELVNKIKWIKRAHQFGFRCANAMTPPWKFLENGDYMDEDSDLDVTPGPSYLDNAMRTERLGKKGDSYDAHGNCHEKLKKPLLECGSISKKWKGKLDATLVSGLGDSEMYSMQHQVDGPSSLRKREQQMDSDSLVTLSSEKGLVDVDADTKPGKKPFPLITPSIHTGFSFSIIHLLSAVRVAMVTPVAGDVSDIGIHIENADARYSGMRETVSEKPLAQSHDVMDASISDQAGSKTLPSLTVQEIVNRVSSNPGDPSILETRESLQDLVRGMLKIFSSKTAPQGAKGWKALVSHEKSTKSWSWIGPVTLSTSDPNLIEEVTTTESWGLSYKMLVKLVDSFANWLKNSQETLKQIGSLPAPPLALMQPNLDEKERFRALRAQKSLTTITPSSEEVRAYFCREEILRYSIPDRAFSYTAVDGRKSIVAPLRRGGGKPSSKARDHPFLKDDRPSHVSILCLVRDAAARLPGSIGTRADVCTLIRDSQYIVEDVSDAQVNQVVSGALDRLHYEQDPCIQFDGERKLWVYLHRDREEDDFEEDGTSSTKKWKWPKKGTSYMFE